MKYFAKPKTPWLIVVIIISLIALFAISKWFYGSQEKQLRNNVEIELLNISQLKVNQIHNWRQDQILNITSHIEGILLKTILHWIANHQQSEADQILSEFRSLQKSYNYRQIFLTDNVGRVLLHIGADSTAINSIAKKELPNTFRSHKPILTDLHTDKNGPIHLDVICPIFSENNQTPLGAIVAVIDAQKYLYPIIQPWLIPSQTAETLLVRRCGNDVLFLSKLLYPKGTALKFRIPLTQTDIPAVMAVLGKEGIMYGKDYRGAKVLSALQAIPDSNWFMITKIDTSEALAAWNSHSILIVSFFITMLMISFLALIFFWQLNRKRYYQNLYMGEVSQRQSEEKYRTMFESISDLIIISDMDNGKIIEYNDKLIGYAKNELKGKNISEIGLWHYSGKQQRFIDRIKTKDYIDDLEMELRKKDGTTFVGSVSTNFIMIENGVYFLFVIRDVSVRNQMEEALRKSEDKYRSLIEQASDGIFISDIEGNYLDVNPSGCVMLGYTREEILLFNIRNLLAKDDLLVQPIRFDELKAGKTILSERRMICKNGALLPVEISAKMLSDGRLQAITRDITERKKSEDMLRKAEEKYRTLTENSTDLIARFDRNLRHLYVNSSAAKAGILSAQEYIGKTIGETGVSEPFRGIWEEHILRVFETKQSLEVEDGFSTPDGMQYFDTHLIPELDADGNVTSVLSLARNITEHRQIEKELEKHKDHLEELVYERTEQLDFARKAALNLMQDANIQKEQVEKTLEFLRISEKKLQEAKTLADEANHAKSIFLAIISHEIRTPMNAIIGFSELLESLITDPIQKNYLTRIRLCGNTLLSLISDVLDFSKIEAGKLELIYGEVSISDLFEEIMQVFIYKLEEKKLDYTLDIASDIPNSVFLDEARLRQVLLNLVGNAVKFTHKGQISINVWAKYPENYSNSLDIIFSVKDTGIGIPEDQFEAIFEPFKQQKSEINYGGTGLGLSISRNFIQAMNGSVSVESKVNEGSTFTVVFRSVEVCATRSIKQPKLNEEIKERLLISSDRGNKMLYTLSQEQLKEKIGDTSFQVITEIRNAADMADIFRLQQLIIQVNDPLLSAILNNYVEAYDYEGLKVVLNNEG
jgi:PAS domain S-box-containing protein